MTSSAVEIILYFSLLKCCKAGMTQFLFSYKDLAFQEKVYWTKHALAHVISTKFSKTLRPIPLTPPPPPSIEGFDSSQPQRMYF